MKYMTDGKGTYAVWDGGYGDDAVADVAGAARQVVIVMRTASNFDQQRQGICATESHQGDEVQRVYALA